MNTLPGFSGELFLIIENILGSLFISEQRKWIN